MIDDDMMKVASQTILIDPNFSLLAILTLSVTVDFGKRIAPICMPFENKDYAQKNVTIAGWGWNNQIFEGQGGEERGDTNSRHYKDCIHMLNYI